MEIETDTGGASLFWSSAAPHAEAARRLIFAGRLSAARETLGPPARAGDRAAIEGLEILHWIARDYSLDAAQMLAKVSPEIPDVTLDDLNRWRLQGVLQHRVLDEQIRFYRAEPANLFRFCDEAKARWIAPLLAPADWKLEDHLARVIEAVDRDGRPDVCPLRQRVRCALTVPADAPGLRPGVLVRVWLAFPQHDRQQRDVQLISSTPTVCFVAPESTAQRTVYFEHRVDEARGPLRFEIVVEFTTSAYAPLIARRADRAGGAGDAGFKPGGESMAAETLAVHLAERPPHIVFTPALRAATRDAADDAHDPLIAARGIYHWICRNIAYAAEEEYGTTPSLVEKVLRTRRGDCGVQAMLFIAMCRCAGIPARWQSGWQTKPVNRNMHDWAEFYIEPLGWLPADLSYGLRDSTDLRIREFYFGNLDAYRMIVNLDYGRPLCPPKQSLRSEPLDFQRGEVEIDGRNLYFDQWAWEMEVLSAECWE